MSKYFRMISSAKLCAALCLVGCAAFIGCDRDEDFVMPVDDETTETTDDSEYEAWVQSFSEEMKKSGSLESGGVVMIPGAAGTTGAAPAFNFAAAATTGAVPTFNFNAAAAATTGSAPAFNFNAAAAATTGDAPAFNFAPPASNKSFDFGAAATTSDSAPAFDFANFAKKNAEEKAAKEAAEKAAKEAEEKAAAEKAEAERKAAEEEAARKAEEERIAAEKAEAERKAAEEEAARKAEEERIAAEKAEAERKAAEEEAARKAAEEQVAKEAAEKAAAENAETPAEAPAENAETPAEAPAENAEAPAEAPAENAEAPAEEPAEAPAEENTIAFFFSKVNGIYSEPVEDDIPSSENLESAIDSLLESLKRDVDDIDMIPNFEDGVLGVRRDANALAVVAMTLGASDYEAPICGVASDLIDASTQLAKAETVADVKKAYQALVAARAKKGTPKKLEWKKVAELQPLMKNALPSISTDVKRLSRNEKTFLRGENAQKVINDSTILAAIALGCRENVDETLAPTEEKVWREYCDRLATASVEFNKRANAVAAGKGSFDEMKEAFKAVEDTCSSTCHEKFGGKAAE